MEYLNWMADHWLLTIVLAAIAFGGLGRAFGGNTVNVKTTKDG